MSPEAQPQDRRTHDARLDAIENQLREGAQRMDGMQTELTRNTEVTTEVRDLLAAYKSGMRVLAGLGKVAVWVGKLAAAGAAISAFWYAITHGGQPPGK